MSTPTARPRQAKAKQQAISIRQTDAVPSTEDDVKSDLETKVDDHGWQVPPADDKGWEIVGSSRRAPPDDKSRPPTPPPRPTEPVPGKRWVPRPMQGPPPPTPAQAQEERRRVAFIASRDRIAPAPDRATLARRLPTSEEDVPPPSATRSKHDLERIRAKRSKARRLAVRVVRPRAQVLPLPVVTKEQAAAPVLSIASGTTPHVPVHGLTPVVSPASVRELSLPPRGPGDVIAHNSPGTTILDNNSGRHIVVSYEDFVVAGVTHAGYFKNTLANSHIPESVGFHYTSQDRVVSLPVGLVASLGAFVVGKVPNMETYLACQAYCRSLTRNIDFSSPMALEDCAIYAPYLAMTHRSHERESIVRKLTGRVYTRMAQKCLMVGAGASALMSLPTATAASAAGAGVAASAGVGVVVATGLTVAAALAVRAGLSYFRPDEGRHALLTSVTSTARPPPSHPDAVIKRLQLDKKTPDHVRANAARVTGLAVDNHAPTVFANNQDNTVAALLKRSASLPPPHNPTDRIEFVNWLLRNWHLLVGPTFKIVTATCPDDFVALVDKWADGCNASPHVVAKYKETARALASAGIYTASQLSDDQIHEWTTRDVSVKNETVLKDEDKSPRQILAATPEFVVLTAPFIKELTGVVRRKWHKNAPRVYTPGMRSKDIADSMTTVPWDHAAKLDFSGYDAAQDAVIGMGEVKVCKLYHAGRATTDLMVGNLKTHGRSRQGVKFTAPYVRNSGDPGTTLFNTVLNAALITYAICISQSKPLLEIKYKCFAGGDDGAVFYDGTRVDFVGILAALGFPVEMVHVNNLNQMEFLACRLTQTATGWNLVPSAGRTIAKLGYSVRADTDVRAARIARGAAQSLYSASHGCPPLRAYLDTLLRLTEGMVPIKPADEPWKMTQCDTGAPTPDTWNDLYEVYGWTRELQSELEKHLASITKVGTVINSAALQLLLDQDSGHTNVSVVRQEDLDVAQYEWSISGKLRNAAQHAAHGNGTRLVGLPQEYLDQIASTQGEQETAEAIVSVPVYVPPVTETPNHGVDQEGEEGDYEQHFAYVKVGDRISGCAVEFSVGTSLSTIIQTSLGHDLDFRTVIVRLDGKQVQVVEECYPTTDSFVCVDGKGLGGSASFAFVMSILSRLQPGVSHQVVTSAVDAIIDHFADTVLVQDDRKEESDATFTFQGKTYVYTPGTTSFARVVSDIAGLPLGVVVNLRLDRGRWGDDATGHFHVTSAGLGGTEVGKNQALLIKMMKAAGVLPTSYGAFIAGVDPMHDQPFRSNGWPDAVSTPSVPECYKQSFVITSAQGTTANWDCSISILPNAVPVPFIPFVNNQTTAAAASNMWQSTALVAPTSIVGIPMGGVNIIQNVSGGSLGLASTTQTITLLPTQAQLGSSRVYSIGLEITNSTAPLYQQGMVTVWRQPVPTSYDGTSQNTLFVGQVPAPGAIMYLGSVSGLLTPAPPATVAEAMLLSGTRQWHAKDGAMIVATPNSGDFPIINGETITPFYYAAQPTDANVYAAQPTIALAISPPSPTNASLLVGTVGFPRNYITDFNMGGMTFTGLSASTTLQGTLHVYPEIFPSQLGNPLTVLAQPSAPDDPIMRELYSRIMKELPVGVPVCENGFGDYFADVVSRMSSFFNPVARVIGRAASVIPHPIAKRVARGARVVEAVTGQLMPMSAAVAQRDAVMNTPAPDTMVAVIPKYRRRKPPVGTVLRLRKAR